MASASTVWGSMVTVYLSFPKLHHTHTSWGGQPLLLRYKMFMLPPEKTACHNFVPLVRIQSHILLRHLFAPLHRWSFKHLLHASSLIIVKLKILGSLRYPWWVKLCRVLVHQVSVFGSTAATEVLHLHHLWQDGLIKVVLQCCCREISLIQVIIIILQINTRHDVGLPQLRWLFTSLSPQKPRVNPRPVLHAIFVVHKITLQQTPPVFHCQYHYTNAPCLFIHHCWCTS